MNEGLSCLKEDTRILTTQEYRTRSNGSYKEADFTST